MPNTIDNFADAIVATVIGSDEFAEAVNEVRDDRLDNLLEKIEEKLFESDTFIDSVVDSVINSERFDTAAQNAVDVDNEFNEINDFLTSLSMENAQLKARLDSLENMSKLKFDHLKYIRDTLLKIPVVRWYFR